MIGAIVPAKGYGDKIERAVQSLLDQTERPACILIVVGDDPKARDVALKLRETTVGTAIAVDAHPHANLAQAWNLGLQHLLPTCATLALLKATDYYKPDKIRRSLAVFGRHASVAAVVSDYDALDGHGFPIRHYGRSFDLARLQASPQFDTNCLVRSAAVAGLTHLFDERLNRSCGYDFFLRIAKIGLIYHVAESLHVVEHRRSDPHEGEIEEQIRRRLANHG